MNLLISERSSAVWLHVPCPFAHNVAVPAHDDLDDRIDDLYRGPLESFTPSRNALVKTLRGADASRVRKLAKPTVVAWAANQLYWRARPIYERLMKSGDRLRKEQIAALQGKPADLRIATDAHRRAIADAVQEAERTAKEEGSPLTAANSAALMRTFETLSLSPTPPDAPGRLTQPLQPAGFEALAGVTPAARAFKELARRQAPEAGRTDRGARSARGARLHADSDRHERDHDERAEARRRAAEEKERAAEEKRRAAEEKKRQAEIARAQAALERAKAAERFAREGLERAQEDVRTAQERLRSATAARRLM